MPLSSATLNRLSNNDPKLFTLDLSEKEGAIDAKSLELLFTYVKANTHLGRIKWPKTLPQDPASQNHLAAIQKKLDQNNQAFTAHPSPYEHAVLSQHVYYSHTVGQQVMLQGPEYDTTHQLPEWEVVEVFDHNNKSGLYAALYVNRLAGHCVLAFRGTEIIPPEFKPTSPPEPTSTADAKGSSESDPHSYWEKVTAGINQTHIASRDLLTDLKLIVGRMTTQQIDAYELVLRIAADADQQGYRLSLTGHSLGGWLAQLMAVHLLWDCYLDRRSALRATCAQLKVVTFDNPGVGAMVATLQPTIEISRKAWRDMLDEFEKLATVYLTVPNPVNTAGKQLGKVYRLLTPIPDINALVFESFFQWSASPGRLQSWAESLGIHVENATRWGVNQTMATLGLQTGLSHSMRYLLKGFDPRTGDAIHPKEVSHWPTVDWGAGKNPTKGWIEEVRKKFRSWTGLSKKPIPTFLLEYAEDFIFDQVLAFLSYMFSAPALKKLPGELSQIPGVIYLWCSGGVNNAALTEFLAFAEQFAAFDINQSEMLMPANQSYELQFKHRYRADPVNPLQRPLQTFGDDERALLDILHSFILDTAAGISLDNLIAGSHFEDPAFQQLQQKFVIESNRVVGGGRTKYLDVRVTQGTLRQFEYQLFRLVMLYQADIQMSWSHYWKQHQTKRAQQESSQRVDQFSIREKVWWSQHQAVYREHQFITNLFADDQPQPIETAFVNVMLLKEEQLHKDKEEKTEKNADAQDSREMRLSSFEDIYTTKTPLPITDIFSQATQKRYLIFGRAGIGKSTLLHYVTYQWAHGTWGQQFEWVFWIKLRNLTPQRYPEGNLNWIDLLTRECFDHPFSAAEKKYFSEVLRQGKVLWLLDGYDEIAGKLGQPEYAAIKSAVTELLAMPQLILTSRPEAIRHDSSFDQRLEIIGFTNDDIEQYIMRCFVHDVESGQRLLNFLRKQPGIWGIAHIPINLQLLCQSWQDQSLESDLNLTQLYQSLVNRLLQRYAQKQGLSLNNAATNLMLDPAFKSLMQSLSDIAFEGMKQGQVVIPADTTNIKPLLALGLIRQVQQESNSVSTVEFIHLTFQEFFAGMHLAHLLRDNDLQAKTIIARNKYLPHFEITWWFTAGLLTFNANYLGRFYAYLLSPPRDWGRFYEARLLVSCLEESSSVAFPGKNTLMERLQAFLLRNVIDSDFENQAFFDRFTLSTHLHIQFLPGLLNLLKKRSDRDFFSFLDYRHLFYLLKNMLTVNPALVEPLADFAVQSLNNRSSFSPEECDGVACYNDERIIEYLVPTLLQAKPSLAEYFSDRVLLWLKIEDCDTQEQAYTMTEHLLKAQPALSKVFAERVLVNIEKAEVKSSYYSYRTNLKDHRIAAFEVVPALLAADPALVTQFKKPLLAALQDDRLSNNSVKKTAIEILRQLLVQPALTTHLIDLLWAWLNDEDFRTRKDALEHFSKLMETQSDLAETLVDKVSEGIINNDEHIRRTTLTVLKKLLIKQPILAERFVVPILEGSESNDEDIQYAAFNAIPYLLTAQPQLAERFSNTVKSMLASDNFYIRELTIAISAALRAATSKPAGQHVIFGVKLPENSPEYRGRKASEFIPYKKDFKFLSVLSNIQPEWADRFVSFINASASISEALFDVFALLLKTQPSQAELFVESSPMWLKNKDDSDTYHIVNAFKILLASQPMLAERFLAPILSALESNNYWTRQLAREVLSELAAVQPALAERFFNYFFAWFDNNPNDKFALENRPDWSREKYFLIDNLATYPNTLPRMLTTLYPYALRIIVEACNIFYETDGHFYFYLGKRGYIVKHNLSTLQINNLTQTLAYVFSYPPIEYTLADLEKNNAEFDADTAEIPVDSEQSDMAQFGHRRRLLSTTDDLQTSAASSRYDTHWLPWFWISFVARYLNDYVTPQLLLRPVIASRTFRRSNPGENQEIHYLSNKKTILNFSWVSSSQKPLLAMTNLRVPEELYNYSHSPIHEEKSTTAPTVTLTCSASSIDEQPVMACTASDYSMHVFPKTSTETALIHFTGQTPAPITGDNYDRHSCRPIEFYGRPSVSCEGNQTTLVYTPQLSTPLFAQLDGNLMLGRVAWHMLGSTYRWIQTNASYCWQQLCGSSDACATQPNHELMGEALFVRFQEIEERLMTLERQLAALSSDQKNRFVWLVFAIHEHREMLEDLQQYDRADVHALEELEQEILNSQQDFQAELRLPHSAPSDPADKKSPAASLGLMSPGVGFFAPSVPIPVNAALVNSIHPPGSSIPQLVVSHYCLSTSSS